MAAWPDQDTAIQSLRRFLHDGPDDHVGGKNKRVIGPTDGENTTFYVLEQRVVVPPPVGGIVDPVGINVTVNNVPVVVVDPFDDPVLGQFSLVDAPPENADVRGTYYYQYFLDDELIEALQEAGQQIVSSDDFLGLDTSMKPAAIRLAASFTMAKLSQRWLDRASDTFVLEDKGFQAEATSRATLYQQSSDRLYEQGIKRRDDVYTRQGRRNVPSWGRVNPSIPVVGTNR